MVQTTELEFGTGFAGWYLGRMHRRRGTGQVPHPPRQSDALRAGELLPPRNEILQAGLVGTSGPVARGRCKSGPAGLLSLRSTKWLRIGRHWTIRSWHR